MGTLYLSFPLTDEAIQWLKSAGVTHPEASPAFRNPTPTEIEAVLAELTDYTYEVRRNIDNHTWYADVAWKKEPSKGPWTEIVLTDYRGDHIPHEFHFCKGWEEVIFLITERLTHICGPLVVADGSDATPYVVMPGAAVKSLIDEYNSR